MNSKKNRKSLEILEHPREPLQSCSQKQVDLGGMSGRSEKFKVRDPKLESRTQFVFMELGHTSNLDLTPNLKLYLRTQSEFRLSQAWAKSAKKKNREGPPQAKPFFAKDKHRSVSKLSAGFGRLGEDIGRLGRCFRRNLGQIGNNKKNRAGPPLYNAFFEKEKQRRVSRVFEPTSKARILDTAPESHYSRL